MGRHPKYLDDQEWSLALTMDDASYTPAKISYVLNNDRDVLRFEGKDFDDQRLVREWIRNRINEIHAGVLDEKYVGCHKKKLPRKPLLAVSETCHEIGHQVETRQTEHQTDALGGVENQNASDNHWASMWVDDVDDGPVPDKPEAQE